MSSSLPDRPTPLPPPTPVEASALHWFTRCQQGLTPAEETAFQDWLVADPRHAVLFREFDGTWNLLGQMAEPPPRIAREPRWAPAGRKLAGIGLGVAAAAAAMILGYAGWWRPAHYTAEAATPVGVIRRLSLPEGSSAFLNTDSAVKVAFTPGRRRVALLRGEVHFVVAPNPERPFVVEADGVAVRAVGTAFAVQVRPAGVDVLVTAGRVRVEDARSGRSLIAPEAESGPGLRAVLGAPVLGAGQRLTIPRLPAAGDAPDGATGVPAAWVSPEEMLRALAWQQDRLEFESAPLAEIVAQFNRFNRHQLVVADPALAQRRFGGAFKPHDHAGLVRMLRQNFGVVAEETEHATVLRAVP